MAVIFNVKVKINELKSVAYTAYVNNVIPAENIETEAMIIRESGRNSAPVLHTDTCISSIYLLYLLCTYTISYMHLLIPLTLFNETTSRPSCEYGPCIT